MSENTVQIILPRKLYILRDKLNLNVRLDMEEYNIYFRNMIYPYRAEFDIQIVCDYGMNLGEMWRITTFPRDVKEFPLEIRVYDEYGKLLASRVATVELLDKNRHDSMFHVLCIGDSMTHVQTYLEHIQHKLHRIQFVGTRSFDGVLYHEGRGGWTFDFYFQETYHRAVGVSPFLFPKGVDAEKYYGHVDTIRQIKETPTGDFWLEGFEIDELTEGDVYLKNGNLYQRTAEADKLIQQQPEFEFSFEKYILKNALDKVDAVSILLGANDLQICSYEESEERISKYIENYRKMITSIREYKNDLPIIINLPVGTGRQYDWGKRGLKTGAKAYQYNIWNASKSLLQEWDGLENDIYISPMLMTLDTQNGFSKTGYRVGKYMETIEHYEEDWVHPNRAGYCQMGDALAPIIEWLHQKKEVDKR